VSIDRWPAENPSEGNDRFLRVTIAEAAEQLGVSKHEIYRQIRLGFLATERSGGQQIVLLPSMLLSAQPESHEDAPSHGSSSTDNTPAQESQSFRAHANTSQEPQLSSNVEQAINRSAAKLAGDLRAISKSLSHGQGFETPHVERSQPAPSPNTNNHDDVGAATSVAPSPAPRSVTTALRTHVADGVDITTPQTSPAPPNGKSKFEPAHSVRENNRSQLPAVQTEAKPASVQPVRENKPSGQIVAPPEAKLVQPVRENKPSSQIAAPPEAKPVQPVRENSPSRQPTKRAEPRPATAKPSQPVSAPQRPAATAELEAVLLQHGAKNTNGRLLPSLPAPTADFAPIRRYTFTEPGSNDPTLADTRNGKTKESQSNWTRYLTLVILLLSVVVLAGAFLYNNIHLLSVPASPEAAATQSDAETGADNIATEELTTTPAQFVVDPLPVLPTNGPEELSRFSEETFSKPGSGWLERDTPTWSASYVDNAYHLTLEGQPTISVTTTLPATDYRLSVDVSVQRGSAGFLFLVDESQRTYRVLLNSAGRYAVQVEDETATTNIIEWTLSNALRRGAAAINRLRVERHGEVLQVFVNDVPVTEWTLLPSEQSINQYGLVLTTNQSQAQATFDNLVGEAMPELTAGSVEDKPKRFSEETFNAPSSGWLERDTPTWSASYVENAYQLVLTDQPTLSIARPITATNYHLSVDVKVQQGSAGLVFLADESGSVYRLLLDNTGSYAIQVENETTSNVVDWTTSAALRHGAEAVNRLRIERYNGIVRVFANDLLLIEWMLTSDQQFEGQYGVAITGEKGRGQAMFDNLVGEELGN